MTSVMDTEEGFARLYKALALAAKRTGYPHDQVLSEKQLKEIALAYLPKTNKVYKDFIYLYPPGCPIIAPGEVFTRETREKVLWYIEQGLEVIEWERSIF